MHLHGLTNTGWNWQVCTLQVKLSPITVYAKMIMINQQIEKINYKLVNNKNNHSMQLFSHLMKKKKTFWWLHYIPKWLFVLIYYLQIRKWRIRQYVYRSFLLLHVYYAAATTAFVGFNTKRLLDLWWLEGFFRPALLHYGSLTHSAHSTGRAAMCSIQFNGMWRIGHPRSGNFHCKWWLCHQGQALSVQRLDKQTQQGLLSHSYVGNPTQNDGVYTQAKYLHCTADFPMKLKCKQCFW